MERGWGDWVVGQFRLTIRAARRERGGEETGREEAEKKSHTLL